MSKKMKAGCGRSATTINPAKDVKKEEVNLEGEKKNMIMVGKPAPTFTAPAYHNGDFTEVSLEDYKGKWVLLCFYPGDFTFV